MNTGERIRQLRMQRNMPQQALADSLGVTRQAVAKWESGASRPSAANLMALCRLFGVSWQQLAGPVRTLLRLMPGMVLGIAGGCVLCALEMWLARHLGRQNMSQEVLRGTRFLVPLSWLLLTCLLSLYWQGLAPLLRRGLVILLAVVLLSLGQGKQVVAARHALADMTGLGWLDTEEARQIKAHSLGLRDALQALRAQAGPEELVFTDGDCMAVRFAARMPMLPVHKDGNVIYYAADPDMARRWLAMQHRMAADATGYMEVWRTEQAALLLTRHVEHKALLLRYGALLFENEDWLLLRRYSK